MGGIEINSFVDPCGTFVDVLTFSNAGIIIIPVNGLIYFEFVIIRISEINESDRKTEISETLTLQEKFQRSIGWTKSDSRPSAIATGTLAGSLFCIIPIVIVFLSDLPTFLRHIRGMWHNITGKETKKPKKSKERRKASKEDVPDVARARVWDEEIVEEESTV